MIRRTRKFKTSIRMMLYFYMLVILMSLLVVASYTWFSITRTPRVSDMHMYINSQSGLMLSPTPQAEEWQKQLDFRDLVDVTAPLRPITWSDQQQRFYAAAYGFDGRLMSFSYWEPLSDERHANKDNLDGYYIKATFYARTGEAANVSLSPAVEVDEGIHGSGTYLIGTPVWDSENVMHNNGGLGAENAVRIGIRVTDVDDQGNPTGAPSEFFIYEPHAYSHSDDSTDYIATPSIDGTENLIDEAHLIRQTASTWTEAYPVQRDVVIKELGKFDKNPVLFSIRPGQLKQIDLYVWLEGQDAECTNQITKAQIFANVQFVATPEGQSGMRPIE